MSRVDAPQAPVRDLCERDIGDEPNARRGRERSSLWGSNFEAICVARQLIVGARKHLERARDIQQLAFGKGEQ
jgi:hypothetical protein